MKSARSMASISPRIVALLCLWQIVSSFSLNRVETSILKSNSCSSTVLSPFPALSHNLKTYKDRLRAVAMEASPLREKLQKKRDKWFQEILAGLVVSLSVIPTSISYSTVIGISPLIGIWNSAVIGLCTALVGGAPGKLICHSCDDEVVGTQDCTRIHTYIL